MKTFAAVHSSGIRDLAWFFGWQNDGPKAKRDEYIQAHEALRRLEPLGRALPTTMCLRMADDLPKENRFYDLALPHNPPMLLVSERARVLLEERKRLEGNDVLRTALRDPKNRPVEQPVFVVRQLVVPACIDEKKSRGTRWPIANRSGYQFLEKLVLDPDKVPTGVHLFRAVQFPEVLFVSEEVMRDFIDAGLVGLDYVTPEQWCSPAFHRSELEQRTLKGPRPGASPPPADSGAPAGRSVPTVLRPFLKAHSSTWLEIVSKGPCHGFHAFAFDWEALTAQDREMLESEFLEGSALEEPEYVPFAAIHVDREDLARELGKRPDSLGDALSLIEGLLLSDAKGRILYLDEGSRQDVASSPKSLKVRALG